MLSKINFILCFLLFIGCKSNNESTSAQVNELVVEIPEDFPAFYTKFHEDSIFQLNHVVFPLSIKPDGSKYTRDSWDIHKPLMGSAEEYIRDYSNFSDIITETIADTMGIFRMERRFSKMDDEWHLIYYEIKTKVF